MQERLDRMPEVARLRRQTVEHPYATLKAWMGATHFLTRTIAKVGTEMNLHVLAYNMKRVMHPRTATNHADDESLEASAPIRDENARRD